MEYRSTNHVKSIEYSIQFLIGFVTVGGYFNAYLINYGTNQLAKALNVSPHKVNIYICKLFGLRGVLLIMGSLTQHLIAVYYSKNYEIFTIVSLCSIFFTKFILLIVLYKSLSLSFYFFIISTLEAFVSGFFQNSLFATVPGYTSTIILSVDISVILTFGTKLLICYFCREKELRIIKVETWSSLIINIISIVMLLFYNLYYYDEYVQTYEEGIKKIKEIIDNWIKINNCLNIIENIDKSLCKILETINEMIGLEAENVIDKKLLENNNIIEKLKNTLKAEDELNTKGDYNNNIEGFKNISQETYNKIEQLVDFYQTKIKSQYQFQNSRMKQQIYMDIDKLSHKIKELNSKVNKMTNNNSEKIKLNIKELNGQFEPINKIIERAEQRDKNIYINMLKTILEDKNKKFITIKEDIENIKLDKMVVKTKDEITKVIERVDSNIKTNENDFFIYAKKCLYKYIVILVASMFKDFLNPNIIPKSILESDKCYLIEKVSAPFYFIASLMVICIHHNIENIDIKNNLDFLGALELIPFVIFVITLMAIHSQLSVFKKILNSHYKVLSLTSLMILSFRIVESWSYISISDIVDWRPEYNYSVCALTLHHVLTVSCSYLFNKVSRGYTETMISLGYTVPFVETKNRQKTRVWYVMKNTLKSTFKNCVFDLRMNVRELI